MRRLSESEKFEIWDRFEAGESLRSISRRLGRPPSTAFCVGSQVLAVVCEGASRSDPPQPVT
jgi:hypothetical protein